MLREECFDISSPNSTLKIVGYDKGLIWVGKLQPTNLSITYDIRIEYNIGCNPNIYVISPNPLPLAKDATKLPILIITKSSIYVYIID